MARARLAVVGLFVSSAYAAPAWVDRDFLAWAKEYGKKYTTEQQWQRAVNNFQANTLLITKLNADPEDGAEYGHGRFSDLSSFEFRERYFGSAMDPVEARSGGDGTGELFSSTAAPEAFDWRNESAVTPVRDQGACGSCWAESAVGNMESQWYLANKGSLKAPVPLSVEQVVECDAFDDACYGGYPKGAYKYAMERGLASLADYPYKTGAFTICLANQTFNKTCGDGMCDDPPLTTWCDVTCSDKAHKPVAKIASWTALSQNEDEIAAYLAQHGPVSVGLDAAGKFGALLPWLQFYKKGIANPRFCTNTVDHAVLAVGYGVENGVKYWTIKNSWGVKWGVEGYFRLIRGTGKCGINTIATSAVVTAESGSKTGHQQIVV